MKSKVLVLLVMLARAGFVQAVVMEKISVEGNHFVRPNGETLVFRGLALADPAHLQNRGEWNEAYFKHAAQWNANLVRIPVAPERWRRLGKEAYLKLLDDGIAWAASNQLYVVIDWHSIGNLEDEKFHRGEGVTTLEETLDFWITIAQRYAGNNTVAFYEVFNEPTDFEGRLGTLSWDNWRIIMKAVVGEIRRYDPETIPVLSGLAWAYDLTNVREKPFDVEGIAYSVHLYPQKSKEPWEKNWEKTWGFVADTYPMIALEVGYMQADDTGAHKPCITTDKSHFGERAMTYFNKKGISWTAWCFYSTWYPTLVDKKYRPAPGQGVFFYEVLKKDGTHQKN